MSQRFIRRLALPAYAFSLVLLALTLVMGVEVNGNQNPARVVGGFQIQPSRSPSWR